jgi:hypothetical protein
MALPTPLLANPVCSCPQRLPHALRHCPPRPRTSYFPPNKPLRYSLRRCLFPRSFHVPWLPHAFGIGKRGIHMAAGFRCCSYSRQLDSYMCNLSTLLLWLQEAEYPEIRTTVERSFSTVCGLGGVGFVHGFIVDGWVLGVFKGPVSFQASIFLHDIYPSRRYIEDDSNMCTTVGTQKHSSLPTSTSRSSSYYISGSSTGRERKLLDWRIFPLDISSRLRMQIQSRRWRSWWDGRG